MSIRTMIIQAKLAQRRIHVLTDDGERLTGIVDAFEQDSLKLRYDSGLIFVPIRDIEAVIYE